MTRSFAHLRRVEVEGNKVPLVLPEFDRGEDVIVFLACTPETLEFLTDVLPQGDAFTEELYAIRDEAMKELWGRHS